MADFQAVIPVLDPIALKYIPVQIVLDKVQMYFSESARAAAVFLTMAQDESETPIVAVEVRQDKKCGVYIKYLAEKPNKHNVRRKTFAERWEEIRNTVYEITLYNTPATEKVFLGGRAMIQFLTKEIYDFANFISDDKVPPVDLFVVPNCDSLETEDGEYGFGIYIPEENRIILAEGVEDEVKAGVLGTLAHEYYHHIQHCNGLTIDEDAADKYATLMLERWEGKFND